MTSYTVTFGRSALPLMTRVVPPVLEGRIVSFVHGEHRLTPVTPTIARPKVAPHLLFLGQNSDAIFENTKLFEQFRFRCHTFRLILFVQHLLVLVIERHLRQFTDQPFRVVVTHRASPRLNVIHLSWWVCSFERHGWRHNIDRRECDARPFPGPSFGTLQTHTQAGSVNALRVKWFKKK